VHGDSSLDVTVPAIAACAFDFRAELHVPAWRSCISSSLKRSQVARDKPPKPSDGGGLNLLVQPGGSKLWLFWYCFAGRENVLSLGGFPAISLTDARAKRNEPGKLVAAGTDPAAKKRLDNLAAATAARKTFGAVASEYLEDLAAKGAGEMTMVKNRRMLLASITPQECADYFTDRGYRYQS
jgi:hypothetical protein